MTTINLSPGEIQAALQRADELERHAKAATAGPWVVGGISHDNTVLAHGDQPDPDVGFPDLWPVYPCYAHPNEREPQDDEPANLAFIAHARNNAEQIVADVRELVEELERLKGSRDAWLKACRFLYAVCGEGNSKGRPMDIIHKREWQRVVELIGQADAASPMPESPE